MRAVAYLDLLGFSNTVLRNAEEALAMLNSYNSILHFGIMSGTGERVPVSRIIGVSHNQ